MGRNTERDEREAIRRKSQLINAGFELFSANGIETVSLNVVAEKADVGVATMYNYFQNKVNFVIAISTSIWGEMWEQIWESFSDELSKMTAYELVDFYCNRIIEIYNERPELLKFSANYKTFLHREGATQEQYSAQIEALDSIWHLFQQKYHEAKGNQCIRTDIPEDELFSSVTVTMLSMAERYTQGIVWANTQNGNHSKDLIHLKEMILGWVKPQTAAKR